MLTLPNRVTCHIEAGNFMQLSLSEFELVCMAARRVWWGESDGHLPTGKKQRSSQSRVSLLCSNRDKELLGEASK